MGASDGGATRLVVMISKVGHRGPVADGGRTPTRESLRAVPPVPLAATVDAMGWNAIPLVELIVMEHP